MLRLILPVLVIAADAPASLKADLIFLTRAGCVNTPEMQKNLDDALRSMHWPTDYAYVDVGSLPKTDGRTAYPTPTLLWKRQGKGGVPTPAVIATALTRIRD